ncbi:hypothetical protein DVA86_13960 [Streptomyces armeniacus]|uniref:Uncharacterized protein n=1 Tax=Streptomyces armeniacus TaxID=83291 RepID=A0A345XPM6_9ACTN|nr:hypothetical protein [Streptomyces armeniacus]AXK33592.1 hypothetical protein DVA86_13960 [Streptomyces armeniacus]
MRAPLMSVIRVCREVAYGIDTMNAITHGKRPSAPPYAVHPGARVQFPDAAQAREPMPEAKAGSAGRG